MRSPGPCHVCKCEMLIPDALYKAAQHGKGKVEFYCAYGHGAVFAVGETEETKLRRERDRLVQRLAEKDDDIKALEVRRRAAVGQVTKLKNRVGNGVCPCCTRSFTNLQRHMTTEHPEFKAEAAE